MSGYALEAEQEIWDAVAANDAPRPRNVDGRQDGPRRVEQWSEHYSPRNVQLLELSGATEVAGYREWQRFGRQVRKGEHGIRLAAPVVVKDKKTGESRMVNVSTATVFDVSQTDPIAFEAAI